MTRPRGELANSLSRMEAEAGSLSDVERQVSRLAEVSVEILGYLYNEAAVECIPTVYRFIRANYESSGIKTRTGRLARALAGIRVNGISRNGAPVLRIRMPSGVGEYEKGKRPFYTVAASLNYGSVHMRKVTRQTMDLPTKSVKSARLDPIGAKAKRTVKKLALKQKVSKRAMSALSAGSYYRGIKVTEGYNPGHTTYEDERSVVMSGGATVRKPRPYFYLTEMQKGILVKEFIERVSDKIGKALPGMAV